MTIASVETEPPVAAAGGVTASTSAVSGTVGATGPGGTGDGEVGSFEHAATRQAVAAMVAK